MKISSCVSDVFASKTTDRRFEPEAILFGYQVLYRLSDSLFKKVLGEERREKLRETASFQITYIHWNLCGIIYSVDGYGRERIKGDMEIVVGG